MDDNVLSSELKAKTSKRQTLLFHDFVTPYTLFAAYCT